MFYWLDLTGESILSVGAKLWQDGCIFLSRVPPLYGLFAELLDESSSELQRSALVGQIFDRFISEAVFDASRESSAADHILRYISENYRENIDLRQMSDRFYLSQNQIIRIVRARTGYTPHEYLIRFRLTKACELLQGTQTPVGEIGRIVGYDNNSHFSAAFRGFYGISPTKYRHRFSK